MEIDHTFTGIAARSWGCVQAKQEARRLGLLSPPPYNDERAGRAWQTGYESAIEDIVHGRLALPRNRPASEED